MAKRQEGLARFGDKLVLAVCVLVSLWLTSLDESSRVEKASALAHRLTTPVEWVSSLLDGAASLKSENQQLRSRIASLELDLHHLAVERAQLEQLQERAGFFERSRGTLMPATVLELTVSRFPIQAKIRTFSDVDSLSMWQPVVTERGLVGRVRHVLDRDLGLVQLLTDVESRISVEIAESGVVGLLRYDGRRFMMDQVPRGEMLEVGETVQTSGLGGTVPSGLPVGVVSEVRSAPTELFQHVEIEPVESFASLSRVYVVVRPGPWYSRLTDSPLAAHADSLQLDLEEARR